MPTSSNSLPDNVEALRKIILEQEAQLTDKSEHISTLEEYIRLLKRRRFGTSSERAPVDQLGLFNEAEAMAATEPIVADTSPETIVAADRKSVV